MTAGKDFRGQGTWAARGGQGPFPCDSGAGIQRLGELAPRSNVNGVPGAGQLLHADDGGTGSPGQAWRVPSRGPRWASVESEQSGAPRGDGSWGSGALGLELAPWRSQTSRWC